MLNLIVPKTCQKPYILVASMDRLGSKAGIVEPELECVDALHEKLSG
jgi:ribosomal protein L7Ae-like RNA K-turn-binding protein